MEALSLRSVNIQVQRKPFAEKDFAAADAPKPAAAKSAAAKPAAAKPAAAKPAAAKPAENPKDKEHASPPPSWVFQPPLRPGLLAEKFQTGAFLGRGGFAICYEGELRVKKNGLANCKFAMKIVKAKMTQTKITEKFRTELQIHAKMKHPNIVQFHRAFTYIENTYVILELCPNGSVMDMMKKRKSLTLPEVRRFTVQICGAIKYMHTRNVIHRDLKMGNLFLDKEMNIKLGDFGLAAILATKEEYKGVYHSSVARRTTVCGTPNYIAPEILKKAKDGHDHKVDIWAIGVIVYAMLTGCPPFQSSSQKEIYEKVKNVTYEWPTHSQCINDIPDEAKDLVACLLKADAEERFEPDRIVGHPFFSMNGGSAIPSSIEPKCRVNKPSWLRPESPRGDVMDEGCSTISLRTLARQCGVGHLPGHDEPFKVVGGNIDLSLYKECLAEEATETYPRVPLPRDMVYTSQTALRDWPNEPQVNTGVVTPGNSSKELQSNTDYAAAETEDELSLDLQFIPRRLPAVNPNIPRLQPFQSPGGQRAPALSHAATLRAAQFSTMPTRKTTFQTKGIVKAEVAARAPPSYTGTVRTRCGLLNEQPVRSAPLRLAPVRSASDPSNKIGSDEKELSKAVPRILRSKSASIPVTHQKPEPRAALGRNLSTRSVPDRKAKEQGYRAVQDRNKVPSLLQDRMVPIEKTETSSSSGSTLSGSTLRDSIPDRPRQSSRGGLKRTLISPDEVVECISGTKPAEVLENLRKIQVEIETSLRSISSQSRSARVDSILVKQNAVNSRPAVTRWVDYTNRYGIGYILNNGAVGCLFLTDGAYPRTCIHVRDAEAHLRKKKSPSYSEKEQIVHKNGAPVEYLEFPTKESLKRIFVPSAQFQLKIRPDGTAEKMHPGTTSYDFEKRRKLIVWDKFGKYMCQKFEKGELEESKEDSKVLPTRRRNQSHAANHFVRFFQRIGNVVVWGYGNGSFQFNFPDHTKIILSDSGTWLDFYHLPPKAASSLVHGIKPDHEDLSTRSVLSYPTSIMVEGIHKDTDFRDIIGTNELRDKLQFVSNVLGIWLENGGLGCLGKNNKYLLWEGMGDSGKLLWVTVGAEGGDVRYHQSPAVER